MQSLSFVLVLLASGTAGAQPLPGARGDAGVAELMGMRPALFLVTSVADDRCAGTVLAASRAAGRGVTAGTIDLGDGSSAPRYEPLPADRLVERTARGTREFRVTGLHGTWQALELDMEGSVQLDCEIVDGGALRLSQSAENDGHGGLTVRRRIEITDGSEYLRAEILNVRRADGGVLHDARLSMRQSLDDESGGSTIVTAEYAMRTDEGPHGFSWMQRKRISHLSGREEMLLDTDVAIAANAGGRVTHVRGSGGFYRNGVRVGRVATARGRDFAHVGLVFEEATSCILRFPLEGEDVSSLC